MHHKDCGKYERSLPSLLLPCTRPLLIVFGGRGRNGGRNGIRDEERSGGKRERERLHLPLIRLQCSGDVTSCPVAVAGSICQKVHLLDGWVPRAHIQYKCWKALAVQMRASYFQGKTFKRQLIPPSDNATFDTCWLIAAGYLDRQKISPGQL